MNLVFDFGAVLFTWLPGQLMSQTFPEQAATPDAATRLAHQMFGHADWHDFDRGLLSAQAVVDQTAERLDLPAAAMLQLVNGIGDRLTPMLDTLALLGQLHARRRAGEGVTALYYLSNMPQPYARVLEDKYDFLQWFDGGIFSGDVFQSKPDPAIYQLLQSRYALAPQDTVFIDDLKTNVQAAQALGWHGIHFESAPQLRAQLELLGL
jgi:putative hydrolase of the HAD superfamily